LGNQDRENSLGDGGLANETELKKVLKENYCFLQAPLHEHGDVSLIKLEKNIF
jgi:hypothetical protein